MATVTVRLPGSPADGEEPGLLPGRLPLDLAQLLHLADRAGDLPLPFRSGADATAGGSDHLTERLSGEGAAPGPTARDRLAEARARADDEGPGGASAQLRGAGLLDADGDPLPVVTRALRLLAAPEVLLTLDLAADTPRGPAQLRSWFALRGGEAAQLSTATGLDHELGWYPAHLLSAALERAATVTVAQPASDEEGDEAPEVRVPDGLRLPYDLMLAGTEAVRRHRGDLLEDLARRYADQVVLPDPGVTTVDAIQALERDCRGRLRVTVAMPAGEDRPPVAGLVSWTLLTDGWRWLEPRSDGPEPSVVVHRVAPAELGRVVAPVLARVVR